MFAKIYGTDDDQILVKFDSSDDGYEVRFFFEPPGLGVCSMALEFKESDDAYDKAQAFFNDIDEVKAVGTVRKLKREIAETLE